MEFEVKLTRRVGNLLIRLQVLPPPNVTGALHIGHALTAAIEVHLSQTF